MIWKREFTINSLNADYRKGLVKHLDIRFTSYKEDELSATMPVDEKTVQPYGILHGGASVSLAETLGSVASTLCIPDDKNLIPVGIEINANHLRSVKKGLVTAKAKPIKLGRNLHVWEITITNEVEKLVCTSRLTTMIITKE